MSTTPTDHSEPNAIPETQTKAAKKAAAPHVVDKFAEARLAKTETQTKAAKKAPNVVDKFAEARLAKKKQRRRAHRLTIRRSNTGG